MILTPPLSPSLSAIAKRICELGDWNVSNLRLQKMLYICHMIYAGRTGNKLINENFEAWMYGPVVPTLYHKLKIFGAGPVGNRFYNTIDIPDDIDQIVTEVCTRFKEVTDSQLVSITHLEGGGWSKSYSTETRDCIIKQEDILDEYKLRNAT